MFIWSLLLLPFVVGAEEPNANTEFELGKLGCGDMLLAGGIATPNWKAGADDEVPGTAVAPNPKAGLDDALGAADVNGKVEPDENPKTVDGVVDADDVALDPKAKPPVEADDEVPFNPKIGATANPVISPKVEPAPVELDEDPVDPNTKVPVEAADNVVPVDPIGAEVDDVLLPAVTEDALPPKEKPAPDASPKKGIVEPNKLEVLATEEAALLNPKVDAEGKRLAADDDAKNELLEAEEDAAEVPN